jgi:glucan phosphoethanolaminetransferase (alkaline phosphatase superfamily)
MAKKLIPHIRLAVVFFLLTLIQQYAFYYLKNISIVWLSPEKYLATFCFFLAATFITPRSLKFFFLSFVMLLNFFQMAHLSYFGTQILPSEVYLLFAQIDEIRGTLFTEIRHVLIPLLFTLIPVLLGFWVLRRSEKLIDKKAVSFLFIFYLIYNPARTFVTGNTWGRQPSTRELAGMNVYLAVSYFTGKILPFKLSATSPTSAENSSTRLELKPLKGSDWDHIIFILGESLSPHRMSLFGHTQETTPFLNGLKSQESFFSGIGLSGGVSTDIAVAFLLNSGFGSAGSLKAARGSHCLFRLAKEKNFSTHFLSVQNSQQLRYISPYLCSSFLDDYRSLDEIDPKYENDQAADDKLLMPELKKLLSRTEKSFIMLHQRGSHGPWELRSHEKNRRFPHDSPENHYDNSVVEFDHFFRELKSSIDGLIKKILVIYVSDHGEALGQDGKWGHGQLIRPAFEIPVLIYAHGGKLPSGLKETKTALTHYNVSLILAKELGFRPNQDPLSPPADFEIFGNDIDGFAGKAKILFRTDGTYDFEVIN